jgi:hypothetical protein
MRDDEMDQRSMVNSSSMAIPVILGFEDISEADSFDGLELIHKLSTVAGSWPPKFF